MVKWKFTQWCDQAVGKIRYTPDREMVKKELWEHLEDRFDSYIAFGLSEEEAVERTLEAIGSAEEIAPQFAAIHRPFWGYLYSISKWIFRIAAVVVILLAVGGIASSLMNGEFRFNGEQWDPIYDQSFMDAERIHYVEPDISYHDSGYIFTLTQAAVWESPQRDSANLTFKIRIQALFPGACRPDIIDFLWADDNQSNLYYAYSDGRFIDHDRSVTGSWVQITPMLWEYRLLVYDFEAQGTQFVDIHYDRDGREMVLRIDLTGGDGNEAS